MAAGGAAAGGAAGGEAAAGLCWFSTHNVIIIIATDPIAQFTTGDPVQNADDILPLTSSAILILFPVGVMF